jgi:ADP-ribose pyrophosphatase
MAKADRELLKAAKFTVVERRYKARDGKEYKAQIVKHPGAAVVLPILDDGRLLLIRNRRVSVGETLLEVPAGTLDPGEAPAECAARELTEETGYAAARIEPMCTFYSSPGICTELMYVFLARKLKAGKAAPEATEDIRLEPMSLREALKAGREGRIRDGKSLTAVLFYAQYLQRRTSSGKRTTASKKTTRRATPKATRGRAAARKR